MLMVNDKNMVLGKEIHQVIKSKTKQFNIWIHRVIDDADLKEGKDFCTVLYESTGGRPSKDYEFTLDAAKEICLLERSDRGKELRQWIIKETSKRENLEYVTVKEAAFAVKVIGALKYVENQKEAYSLHQKTFIEHEGMSSYVYADFAKYRAKIVGWDKESVDKCLAEYLDYRSGFNRNKIMQKSMSDKLSIIDVNEAIRVAVLDILFSNGSEEQLAHKFANFVKKMAKELNIEPMKKNETNLFQSKEQINISEIKSIELK